MKYKDLFFVLIIIFLLLVIFFNNDNKNNDISVLENEIIETIKKRDSLLYIKDVLIDLEQKKFTNHIDSLTNITNQKNDSIKKIKKYYNQKHIIVHSNIDSVVKSNFPVVYITKDSVKIHKSELIDAVLTKDSLDCCNDVLIVKDDIIHNQDVVINLYKVKDSTSIKKYKDLLEENVIYYDDLIGCRRDYINLHIKYDVEKKKNKKYRNVCLGLGGVILSLLLVR